MHNRYQKIDMTEAEAKLKSTLSYYQFHWKLNKFLEELLKSFEGKVITRRIKNAIAEAIANNPELDKAIHWVSYEKKDLFDKVSYVIEFRLNRGYYSTDPNRAHAIGYVLGNEERFSVETMKKLSGGYKNIDQWISESINDLDKLPSVVYEWNKAIEMLDKVVPKMSGIPSELYSNR